MDNDDLELLFNSPKQYLKKYFDELRNEIKIIYEKKCESKQTNEEIKSKLNDNYKTLILKIKSYEQECLGNISTDKYDAKQIEETSQIIDSIHSKIDYFTNKFSYDEEKEQEEEQEYDSAEYYALEQEITDLIHAEIAKLEKILFLNKTILFIEKTDCKIPNIFKNMDDLTTTGKLLFFTDNYFNRYTLSIITNKFGLELNLARGLDNSFVKSIFLKNILEKIESDSPIDEIALNERNFESVVIPNRQIVKVDPLSFQGVGKPKLIDLNFNKIKSVDENLFKGLDSLETINLFKNKLTEIPSRLFNGLVNLREINLRVNQIKTLDINLFQGLNNLETIDLTTNFLTYLHPDTFKGLNKLKTLYLGSNSLKKLEKNLFKDLIKLEDLNLSYTQLESIDDELFSSLKNLKLLALHQNSIKSIGVSLFNGLGQLEKLLLNNNELTSLDSNTFSSLVSLKTLILYDNKFNDCQFKKKGFFKFCCKEPFEVLFD